MILSIPSNYSNKWNSYYKLVIIPRKHRPKKKKKDGGA